MTKLTRYEREYFKYLIRIGERETLRRLANESDKRKEEEMKKKEPKWSGEMGWMVIVTSRGLDGVWKHMSSSHIYGSRRHAIKYKPDMGRLGARVRVVRVKITPVET